MKLYVWLWLALAAIGLGTYFAKTNPYTVTKKIVVHDMLVCETWPWVVCTVTQWEEN